MYSEIRDKNFSQVGQTLNRIARKCNEGYDTRRQAKTVSQMRQFIGKLGNLQSEHKSLQIRNNCLNIRHKYSRAFTHLD